jgi:hypothetical protein
MPLLRTQCDLDRATNRLIGWFFAAMGLLSLLFCGLVGFRLLIGG